MTSERRKALLARQRELKARKRRRRGVWLAILVLLLLLLLLLVDCRCAQPPVVVVEPVVAPVVVVPVEAAEAVPVRPRLPRMDRPAYTLDAPDPIPWLESFHLQVAARSPRLAECFIGAERPGRLKWTASVDPVEGHATGHALEPVLLGEELTRQQRSCVEGVLSAPLYKLEVDEARATPSRVGMVIEF